MIYDFDRIIHRRQSDSEKWNRYPEDVLPLWVADMDFAAPEPIIQALRKRVEHGVFGYPRGIEGRPDAYMDLRELVVERMSDRYHWQIQPQDLIFTPGVIPGFNLACHAVAGQAGAVLVQTPVYPPILNAARNTDCVPQSMQLIQLDNGSYAINWEAFESAISDQTRLFILCNPHNPVGKVFKRDELERIAETCLRRDVVICADEIHSDLVFPMSQHVPIASLAPEIAQNTITLISLSKTYNLAGLQCAIAIIPNAKLRKRYLDSRKGLVSWVNGMGLLATEIAYRFGEEWLEQLLNYLQGNRDWLSKFVNERLHGVRMVKPDATYLAWLDCRELPGLDDPYQFFLDKARVALNDGRTFGSGGEGFVRLNFACPRSVLVQALERMEAALNEHTARNASESMHSL